MTAADWRRWAGHRLAQLVAGALIAVVVALVWLWRPAGDAPDRPHNVPALADVASARFYEGQPEDAPLLPLDLTGDSSAVVEEVLAWWRSAETVAGGDDDRYPHANQLRLRTAAGSLIALQAAHDCPEGTQAEELLERCTPAAGYVRTWVDGELSRVRSAELHRWLVSGWAETVRKADVLAGLDAVPAAGEIEALQIRPGSGGSVETLPAGEPRGDTLIADISTWLLDAVAEGPEPGAYNGAPTLVVRIADGTGLEIVRASDCSSGGCAEVPGYVAVTRVPGGSAVRAWAPALAAWMDAGMRSE